MYHHVLSRVGVPNSAESPNKSYKTNMAMLMAFGLL